MALIVFIIIANIEKIHNGVDLTVDYLSMSIGMLQQGNSARIDRTWSTLRLIINVLKKTDEEFTLIFRIIFRL